MSEEVSVNALYQRQQAEILSLSHRNVRNPNPQQFAERAAWLGQDHQSWQDPGVTRAMGYQEGALESVGNAFFSRPSGVVADEQFHKHSRLDAEQQRREAARAERQQNQIAGPFEAAAQLSSARPIYNAKLKSIQHKGFELL